ncbi:hypothetical protein A6R68_22677 [Neotoma lepida]|uniref:PH domain-containing protein n=1 Tax=Neotoma lepida TaxID=56216 RepID=A0A1A6HY02_NEOLE|nr:hypothetical protein A6R68_22677 [Neotoma lepida]
MSGSGNDVVCTGWLRKLPLEKLRGYAWKKRWFILRSGWMSGDPDVLEYYKNEHSKKPLWIINLNFCEQVDAGLTFKKKELQDSFVFDVKTGKHTFYPVAETEADMNKVNHTFNSSSSQYCCPISTQNITNTDLGDNQDSPAPKKGTGNVNYLALDFQPGSLSPHRKPSTSSVTSDENVDYVQVDKEKPQALQNTIQEWTDMRQSSELFGRSSTSASDFPLWVVNSRPPGN